MLVEASNAQLAGKLGLQTRVHDVMNGGAAPPGLRIVGGQTGPRALLIEPVEKAWGPDYLRFGLGLASDFSGDSQFNALVQYRKTWLNRLGAEWTTEMQVGQNTHLMTEFYQPLNEAGKWFVAPSFYIGQQSRGVFDGEDKVAEYLTSVTQGGLDGGAVLGTWGQLRAGYAMSRVHARVETGSPVLPSIRETTAGLRAALFVDQTDAAWFPRSGYRLLGTSYFAMESLGFERRLQPGRGQCNRGQELGSEYSQCFGERRLVARLEHAGLRVFRAGRANAAR